MCACLKLKEKEKSSMCIVNDLNLLTQKEKKKRQKVRTTEKPGMAHTYSMFIYLII